MRWAETGARNVSCHYAPVDVAAQLAALLEAQSCAWMLTSATLAVGDDFSHFKRRCGLARARSVRFESPFDFAEPGAAVPAEGPRRSRRAGPHARRGAGRAAGARGERRPRVPAVHEPPRAARGGRGAARAWGDAPPVPVLVQGDASRDQLLRAFREAGNAVLLGTGSFWEGVDVKGAALSVVIIDKLPFAAPDDPLLKARLEAIRAQGGNPFFDEQVPQAVIALKQGVGRLIRDAGRLRRRDALRHAPRHQGLRPDRSSRACRRCSARGSSRRCRSSCGSGSGRWRQGTARVSGRRAGVAGGVDQAWRQSRALG